MSRKGRPPSGTPLTERERQVLILLAHGHTREATGNYLNIRESTVDTHVLNIMARTGTNELVSALIAACAREQLRIESRPRSPKPEVTGRTHAVLLGIARGLSNKQIAKELRCKINSVRYETEKLYELLVTKNRSRVHLVFMALKAGIITIRGVPE